MPNPLNKIPAIPASFWLPSDRATVVEGLLHQESNEFSFVLKGDFEASEQVDEEGIAIPMYDLVYCRTAGGQDYWLFDVYRDSHQKYFGEITVDWAKYAIRGLLIPLEKNSSDKFTKITVRNSPASRWYWDYFFKNTVDGVVIPNSKGPTIAAYITEIPGEIAQSSKSSEGIFSSCDVLAEVVATRQPLGVSFKLSSSLFFEPMIPLTGQEIRDQLIILRDFLRFWFEDDSLKAEVELQDVEGRIAYLIIPSFTHSSKDDTYPVTLPDFWSEMSPGIELPALLLNWFSQYQLLIELIRHFNHAQAGRPVDDIVNGISCLEGFHIRTSKIDKMALKDRLFKLASQLPPTIKTLLFSKKPMEVCEKLADTRNYYAHGMAISAPKRAAKKDEPTIALLVAKIIYSIIMFKIGVHPDVLAKLIKSYKSAMNYKPRVESIKLS